LDSLNSRFYGLGSSMAFQRRKPAAIGDKASYPGFIEPELATSVDRVPSSERWLHEIKFDETLPIAGFALDDGKFDGIYLGRLKGKDLIYAGKVDRGFDTASAKDLQARLRPLIRKTQPYAKKIAHRGVWVEPALLAEIEYRAKSAEGKVRHPFFKGIREDL
jgi:ATP-dependent DNA ligase